MKDDLKEPVMMFEHKDERQANEIFRVWASYYELEPNNKIELLNKISGWINKELEGLKGNT